MVSSVYVLVNKFDNRYIYSNTDYKLTLLNLWYIDFLSYAKQQKYSVLLIVVNN